MIWESTLTCLIDGVFKTITVQVTADSMEQARELILAQYGPIMVNLGTPIVQIPEV